MAVHDILPSRLLLEGAIISTTHLRTAAGACVLSAGLLIVSAQGAIAVAEPESSNSTGSNGESQGSESAGQGATTPNRPVTTITRNLQESVRKTLEGVTSTIGVLGKPSHRSTPSGQPSTEASTPAAEENDSAESSPAEPEVTAFAEDSEITPTEPTVTTVDTTAAAADPGASATPPPSLVTNTPEPAPLAAPGAPSPPPNQVSVVVEPIAHMVGAMAYVALSGAVTVISLPTSETPVADVITYVQTVLTTMTDAVIVPLVQLPGDIYSLLVLATNQPEAMLGAAVARDQWLTAPAGAPDLGPVAVPPALLPSSADIWTMPLLGETKPLPALGTIGATGLPQKLSVSGLAAPVSEAVSTPDAKSVLEHAVSAIVVPASISALAALALPGIGGLLIVIAAGVRVGYRQAKASLALRVSGIARFAGPGPLGVVRAGALITIHHRGSRRERPDAARAAPALAVVEQAA